MYVLLNFTSNMLKHSSVHNPNHFKSISTIIHFGYDSTWHFITELVHLYGDNFL